MTTKSELLQLLESRRGETVSGAELAAKLGVSRAAVWKAAESLRAEGLPLHSAPGSGYYLSRESDRLSPEGIQAWLRAPGAALRVVEEVSSTNLLAKQWAIEGAPHGSLVVATRQTGGRGRLGRAFTSPPGGIYMSVVLRPHEAGGNPVLVTAAAAVAVCRVVSELCGLELQIKWVNDLYIGAKKCCGILSEAGTNIEDGSIDYIVVGIGINYRTKQSEFAEALQPIAGSLYPDGDAPCPRAQVIAAIHAELLAAFSQLGEKGFLPEYRARSNVLGRQIMVMAAEPYAAQALSIDSQARLVVRREDGKKETLSSGEISIRLNDTQN